jgi:hypothetical protein
MVYLQTGRAKLKKTREGVTIETTKPVKAVDLSSFVKAAERLCPDLTPSRTAVTGVTAVTCVTDGGVPSSVNIPPSSPDWWSNSKSVVNISADRL